MPCLACQRDHRSELGTRQASHRRQHRYPDTQKIIFVPTQLDDVEHLCRAFHERERTLLRSGVDAHDTAARSIWSSRAPGTRRSFFIAARSPS